MIRRRCAHQGQCGPDRHRGGDSGTRRSVGSVLSALEEGGADRISDEVEVQGHDARRDPASARSERATQTGSQSRMKFGDVASGWMQAMRHRLPFSSLRLACRLSMQVMQRCCTPSRRSWVDCKPLVDHQDEERRERGVPSVVTATAPKAEGAGPGARLTCRQQRRQD
jgi:hypothetical protein